MLGGGHQHIGQAVSVLVSSGCDDEAGAIARVLADQGGGDLAIGHQPGLTRGGVLVVVSRHAHQDVVQTIAVHITHARDAVAGAVSLQLTSDDVEVAAQLGGLAQCRRHGVDVSIAVIVDTVANFGGFGMDGGIGVVAVPGGGGA